MPEIRARILLALAAACLAGATTAVPAARSTVHLLTVEGVINPLTAEYLAGGLERAASEQAAAVVVQLNTPGGLERSMRRMVEAILGSPVPVIVYVTPGGGRAASAGMFITLAGHVAAMSPGTNIGAAHPVGLGGDADEVRQAKVVKDAAALARGLATMRGRNAAWAEEAVFESVSITAREAMDREVIDLVAADLDALLRRVDGETVRTAAGAAELSTAGAPIDRRPMSLPSRILHAITDPNVAYLLFTLGMVGLMAELYNPGILFPGITGAISLLLAFTAFGSLPLNWAAVALLVLAAALFVADLYTEGLGVLAVGGLVAFVLGSLLLYSPFSPTSPAVPDVGVSVWLIAVMALAIAGFFFFVIQALVRAQRRPVSTGAEALVGRPGTATSELAPEGTVRVDSESWHAVAEDGTIHAGEPVQVVGVQGVTLRVKRNGSAAAGERSAVA